MRQKSHIFETLRRYLRNLFRALLGRNPFRAELAELREQYEKVAENVATLTDLYYKSQELLDEARGQAANEQRLVENLRRRIEEKDEEIQRMQLALRNHGAEIDYYGEKA